MLVEQYFVDRGNYPKVSETSTPIDAVEWFAKNKGITNLDDPKVKVRSIIDDVNESEMARHEAKKVREARARSEYIDALFALEDGTAVHRQKNAKNDALKKAKAIKKATQVANPQSNKSEKNPKLLDKRAAMARRKAIMAKLKSGGRIAYISQKDCEGGYAEYQRQYTDVRWIVRTHGLSVVRMQSVRTGQSYFVLDDFICYHTPNKINGYLEDANDKAKLLAALTSHKLLQVCDIASRTKAGARSVAVLASQYELNVYTIFDGRDTVGWIAIAEQ